MTPVAEHETDRFGKIVMLLGDCPMESVEIAEALGIGGPVTVYSHLQACGIINDHGRDCPRYDIVNAATATVRKRRDREKGVVDFS